MEGSSNLANSKSYKAIFVLSKKDFSIKQINELVKVLEIEILKNRRVSYDVYNYDKGLIVAHDFKSVEDAEETIEKIKESIDYLQLKNNFVSLSSQYKHADLQDFRVRIILWRLTYQITNKCNNIENQTKLIL